jgi:hypothetical protein
MMETHRLKARLHYMTERFGEHAPRWQFMVWARQVSLLFVVYGLRGRDIVQEVAANATIGDAVTVQESTFNAQAGRTQAFCALIIFLFFWLCHHRMQPYHFYHQNAIESVLFAFDAALMSGGLVLLTAFSKPFPQWFELALLVLIVGTNCAVILYLLVGAVRSVAAYVRSSKVRRDIADLTMNAGVGLKARVERKDQLRSNSLTAAAANSLGDRLMRGSFMLHASADKLDEQQQCEQGASSPFGDRVRTRRTSFELSEMFKPRNSLGGGSRHTISTFRARRRSAFESTGGHDDGAYLP